MEDVRYGKCLQVGQLSRKKGVLFVSSLSFGPHQDLKLMAKFSIRYTYVGLSA